MSGRWWWHTSYVNQLSADSAGLSLRLILVSPKEVEMKMMAVVAKSILSLSSGARGFDLLCLKVRSAHGMRISRQ